MAILITIRSARAVNKDSLRRAVRAALRAEAAAGAEVSILVTDDDEMRQLNRRYRRRDAPTDVLAFPQDEPSSPAGERGPRLLGDVVISAETAQRQARERRASFDGEMQLLAIHGVLHLTGWADERDDQRRRMLGRARAIQHLARDG